ncbi:hypothetical protein [Actinophytocola gossypii]|uniref:Uncharacterized protein n=1 Tax=Actinophytocola gossypii TaxID=2812003 RepID=A0ABT2J724_9PSEU|nr:hypothetical protein [Actinophytocola gossypii]MCT2583663.1 hypothetical protein [Actinophytocola gossypii]
MRQRVVIVAAIAAAVVGSGIAGVALAQRGAEDVEPAPESADSTSNDGPGSASEYWTDERKRNATGG